MHRRQTLQAFGTFAFGGFAGCLGGAGGQARVRMDGLEFRPSRVSVDVGGTIEWVNESNVAHTVTAYEHRLPDGASYWASGGFDSEAAARENLAAGLVRVGETYVRTFEAAGQHPYFCVPHEGTGMTGVVSVG